jgi:DNA polymerase-3 subunit gamma/tau
LCEYFRNLLILATGGRGVESLLDLPEDEIHLLRGELDKTSPESLHLIFQMVLKAEEEIRRSSLPRVALEMLLLRLTQLPRLEPLEEILAKLNFLENRLTSERGCSLAGGTAVAAAQRPANRLIDAGPPEAASMSAQEPFPPPQLIQKTLTGPVISIDPSDTVGQWPNFVRWLKIKDGILAAKLADSQVTLVSETTLGLEVMEIFIDVVKEPQALGRLTEAARAYFGHDFQWAVRPKASPNSEARELQGAERVKSDAAHWIAKHPLVSLTVEMFEGVLVEVRTFKSDRSETDRAEISTGIDDGPSLQ